MRRTVLAAALLLPNLAAAEAPPTMPLRDVDVTYQLPVAPGQALSQRMRWLVSAGRLRVDPPSPGLYMIVDYRAKRMQVVKPADQAVLDMAAAAPGLPGAAAGSYTRGDDSAVGGLGCTNWATTDAAGRQTTLCLTADGVMLRASQAGHVLLEATSVQFGPQDPAAFEAPAGYRHVDGAAK